jgi:PAS domain S-box-containing protein
MVASLSEALLLSDEARVVTTGSAPYRIVHTNKAWHRLTGYKFTEAVNCTSAFLQGPETQGENLRELSEGVASGHPVTVRLINYTKAGDPFYNTLTCNPLRDSNGQLTHYCGVLHGEPVNDREVAPIDRGLASMPPLRPEPCSISEARLQMGAAAAGGQRKRRRHGCETSLAEALNNQTDAVVMTQPHPPYAITHVNQPWCEMCGYTLEEVEGMTNSILQGPETDRVAVSELMASVGRNEPAEATLVNYKKGGVRFVNHVKVMPVYNEEEEIEQFMAMLQEVEDVSPQSESYTASTASGAGSSA